MYDEDLYDIEQQIKRDSIQQETEIQERSADHNHNDLSDQERELYDEKSKTLNGKYLKLQPNKEKSSFYDWIYSNIINPIESIFDPQSPITKPCGVIFFNSPMAPFTFSINN